MARNSIIAGVGAVTLCAFTPMAIADTPCPGRLEGKFDSSQYHFSYESWLLTRKGSNSNFEYQFGAAIHNRNSTTLWIDWKEMNLSGYVPPDKQKSFEIGDPTGACDVVDADIWFGDAPFLLSKVSGIRPRSKGFVATLIQIATDKILEYFKKQGKVFTASDSTLYVPLDQEPIPKDFAEFHVQFTSEVSAGDYKLGLSLSLNADDRSKVQNFMEKSSNGILFTALFDDPFIAQGLRKNGVSYTKSDLGKNEPAAVFQASDIKDPRVDGYRVTHLVFEDAQRRRIGTMPVAILQPNLQPRNNR